MQRLVEINCSDWSMLDKTYWACHSRHCEEQRDEAISNQGTGVRDCRGRCAPSQWRQKDESWSHLSNSPCTS